MRFNIDGFENIEFEEKKNLGGTANYYIDISKNYFIKKSKYKKLHENELSILKLLHNNKIEWCPKVLYYNDEIIIMSHCGSLITNKNLPENYEEQIKEIINDLERCAF